MTGKTHRVGGMLCCIAGYSVLQDKGMLINNVSPLLQLTVMYPFAIYGSVVSDLDHNWHSAPCKDIVSFGINKLLHLTTGLRQKTGKSIPVLNVFDAQHRSWQTHSDLFFILACYLSYILLNATSLTANGIVVNLVATGLILGIASHLFLDMLTPEGIWSILLTILSKIFKIKLPSKVHFVPKSKFFATGGKWEDLVRNIMWVICFILIIRLVYIISPYKISFNF